VESNLNQTRFALSELGNEIVRNRAINERFATENTALQEAVTQTQAELARLTVEKTKVISETDRSLEKRAEAERERQTTTQKTNELISQSEKLQQEISAREQTISKLEQEQLEQKTENEKLLASIEQIRATLAALKHEKEVVSITLEENRSTLEEAKTAVEAMRNKQAELNTIQLRVRELAHKEESLKGSVASHARTEKAVAERIAKLEQQENQVLSRIDLARSNVAQLEQTQANLSTKNAELQVKLNHIVQTTDEAIEKRDSITSILKRETTAVQQARLDLREIETIKNGKLREIEALKLSQPRPAHSAETRETSTQTTDSPLPQGENSPQELPGGNTSQHVRAEAEKTLESLRRHLDGIITKRPPSKS
jgi:chromosome segregation ATPase